MSFFAHPMPEKRTQLVEKIKLVWDKNVIVELIQSAARGFIHRAEKVIRVNGRHLPDE